ncbi:hypothetical protein A9Q76_01465 [Arcobacter sp. 31_11_sub10_T18]|nr:hypothetical protein A9Q76_01465 [Arcobacter sp. 31_11_sub10_T18]
MPQIKTDKECILKNAIHLFKVHGYYKTSIADISKACGLVKGSLYHHFKGKQEIGLACLKYLHSHFNETVFIHAYDTSLTNKEQLHKLASEVEEYFLNSEGGCLWGNWALEVINDIPEFKLEIQACFKSWEDAIFSIIKSNYAHIEAREIAKKTIANTQGALMMMRLYDDTDIFLKCIKNTQDLLS